MPARKMGSKNRASTSYQASLCTTDSRSETVITYRTSPFLCKVSPFFSPPDASSLFRYCRGVDNSRDADAKPASESGLHSRKQGGKQAPSTKSSPWFKFDDETVSKVQLKDVLDAEAYILM
jgi:hypothetical protein